MYMYLKSRFKAALAPKTILETILKRPRLGRQDNEVLCPLTSKFQLDKSEGNVVVNDHNIFLCTSWQNGVSRMKFDSRTYSLFQLKRTRKLNLWDKTQRKNIVSPLLSVARQLQHFFLRHNKTTATMMATTTTPHTTPTTIGTMSTPKKRSEAMWGICSPPMLPHSIGQLLIGKGRDQTSARLRARQPIAGTRRWIPLCSIVYGLIPGVMS